MPYILGHFSMHKRQNIDYYVPKHWYRVIFEAYSGNSIIVISTETFLSVAISIFDKLDKNITNIYNWCLWSIFSSYIVGSLQVQEATATVRMSKFLLHFPLPYIVYAISSGI